MHQTIQIFVSRFKSLNLCCFDIFLSEIYGLAYRFGVDVLGAIWWRNRGEYHDFFNCKKLAN